VRRKRTGELAQLDAGKELLSDFGEERWRLYAEPNLARSTLHGYASIWDAHVLPRLGSIPLRELTSTASIASVSSWKPTASGPRRSERR
jgi:hypothetical protein